MKSPIDKIAREYQYHQNFQFAFDCADPNNMYIETLVSYDWNIDLLVHFGVFCSLMVSLWSEEWEGLGAIPLEIFSFGLLSSPEFTISPILSKKNCFHGSWRFLIGLRLDLRSPLTAVLRSKIFPIWSAKVIYKDDSFSFDSELPAFQLILIEFFPLFCWIFLFSWK